MGFYLASSYVLCTLMLLSMTEADEYPVENIFSGINVHKCDNIRYVTKGVRKCMQENIPRVPILDGDVFVTSRVEDMVTEMCSAKDKVTACMTTLFKDCPNKEEIMEGDVGRYMICVGDRPQSWITQWAGSNSQAQLTENCSVVVQRAIGEKIQKCVSPDGIEELNWHNLTVAEGSQLIRKYITESFECSVMELKDHGTAIENEPECDDLGKWSNILTMLALYFNSNIDFGFSIYLPPKYMTIVQLYAVLII